MADPATDMALRTVDLLASRVERVEFAITGRSMDTAEAARSRQADSGTGREGHDCISKRIGRLEGRVRGLAAQSDEAKELLDFHQRYRQLLRVSYEERVSNDGSGGGGGRAAEGSGERKAVGAEQLGMVLAAGQQIRAAASQLRMIDEHGIPPTKPLAVVAALSARVAAAARRQLAQDAELAALRRRSAILLLRWYDGSVVGRSRCWADWDARLERLEAGVQQAEALRRQEATLL